MLLVTNFTAVMQIWIRILIPVPYPVNINQTLDPDFVNQISTLPYSNIFEFHMRKKLRKIGVRPLDQRTARPTKFFASELAKIYIEDN